MPNSERVDIPQHMPNVEIEDRTGAFDIDEIIPAELKEAIAKDTSLLPSDERVIEEPKKAKRVLEEEEVIVDEVVPDKKRPAYEIPEQDEDILGVEDDIDEILGLKKTEDTSEKEEKPFWTELEAYKPLAEGLRFSGLKDDSLNTFVKEVVDKAVIDNSKYKQSLESKLNKYESELLIKDKEIGRLKNIEKSAFFDGLPETQEKFIKPMTSDLTEIQKILQYEGIDINPAKIVTTANKAELAKLFKDTTITDDDFNNIISHWRSYRDTLYHYNNEKGQAQKDLSKSLKTDIADDVISSIVKEVVEDVTTNDEEYSYIKEALMEGADKHEDVAEIIANSHNNFYKLVKALGNPTDFARDPNWLRALAIHELQHSHRKAMTNKYYNLKKEYDIQKEKLVKVAKAFKKIKGAGSGISGKGKSYTSLNTNGAAAKPIDDDLIDKYTKFTRGELDFSELF